MLGLFFLGITWRKLLSQTTVFTIAHATTLFLSTYGIFRLPSRYVEPAIALSIAWIAIENVLKPRLGPGRLAIVFGFGLVHGLGFASSLSEIPFPKRDFLIALLGFNFGVDIGQLFIIAVAFLGWAGFAIERGFAAGLPFPAHSLLRGLDFFGRYNASFTTATTEPSPTTDHIVLGNATLLRSESSTLRSVVERIP